MADLDLLFEKLPVASPGEINLVFGEEVVVIVEGSLAGSLAGPTGTIRAGRPNDATLAGTLPGPSGSIEGTYLPLLISEGTVLGTLARPTGTIRAGRPNDATLVGTLPGITGSVLVTYDLNVERPVVGRTQHTHQIGQPLETGVQSSARKAQALRPGVVALHQQAVPLPVGIASYHQAGLGLRVGNSASHTEADRLRAGLAAGHQEMLRGSRPSVRTGHQEGVGIEIGVRTAHQERYRDRRPAVRTGHTEADPLRVSVEHTSRTGLPIVLRRWHRHQEAMKPPAGRYVPPVVPPFNPCYTPDPDLLFASAFGATPHLLFICDNDIEPPPPDGQVVVPVRSCYLVLNDVYLKRVAGSVMLKATTMSLNIDVDSWTWSFSASLPISDLDAVEPVAGVPVEVEAQINGSVYRFLVEKIATERVFPRHSIRISGRGKSALLASPYAPVLSFANTADRTAQQLMADVLTDSGVPLGWDIDWNLEDWLVPAGVFGMNGSYMDALTAISGAAGAYIQPHPTAQELSVSLRYPALPWAWGTVSPDFVLPSSVATREGIEFTDKPRYNRVFVSGQQQGRLVRVTRAGSDGGLLAPMVTDSLITAVEAGRQRGASILADTGRQAIVGLSLPVLEETGVITPGKFVRYEDPSGNRTGIVRSTGVEVSQGGANVRQSLTVETHEE